MKDDASGDTRTLEYERRLPIVWPRYAEYADGLTILIFGSLLAGVSWCVSEMVRTDLADAPPPVVSVATSTANGSVQSTEPLVIQIDACEPYVSRVPREPPPPPIGPYFPLDTSSMSSLERTNAVEFRCHYWNSPRRSDKTLASGGGGDGQGWPSIDGFPTGAVRFR